MPSSDAIYEYKIAKSNWINYIPISKEIKSDSNLKKRLELTKRKALCVKKKI